MNFHNMKKIAASLLVILFTVTIAGAQNKQEKKVDSFTRIAFRTAGKLLLRQGSPQKVEIEGDRKFIEEELDVRVEGDKLIIGKESNWGWGSWGNDDEKVTVYVTVPNIEGISVSGSGDLLAQTKIVASRLSLAVYNQVCLFGLGCPGDDCSCYVLSRVFSPVSLRT